MNTTNTTNQNFPQWFYEEDITPLCYNFVNGSCPTPIEADPDIAGIGVCAVCNPYF